MLRVIGRLLKVIGSLFGVLFIVAGLALGLVAIVAYYLAVPFRPEVAFIVFVMVAFGALLVRWNFPKFPRKTK